MKYILPAHIFLLIITLCNIPSEAQNIIQGRITDHKNNPVPYAGISITGTYEGTAADDSGRFELRTSRTGVLRLSASAVGFETGDAEVNLAQSCPFINIELKEARASLSPAVITAGTFAAGDQGKAELFKPRDIGTTAGNPGDIQATIESLPGTQRVGYTEGLFVRGGSGRESKYYMDGLIYPNPYFSSVPSLKQHGRLDPFLFSGTVFSAGGYSAQYGQALSSVLILNSRGIADSTKTGGGIHSFGGNIFHTQRWDKASLSANINYNDLSVYHNISNTRAHWSKSPLIKELRLVYRLKPSKNSMIKVFADVSDSKTGIRLSQTESLNPTDFKIHNQNFLLHANFTQYMNDDRSSFYAGASVSGNFDDIIYSGIPLKQSDKLAEVKLLFKRSLTNDLRILAGADYMGTFLFGRADSARSSVDDHLLALFTEGEATLNNKLALRAGIRSELSQYAGNSLAPRLSLAYKFSGTSQISLSYGIFHQLPDKTDMLFNPQGVSQERASHYLLNYQFQKNERTLRAELYYKEYHNLLADFDPQPIIKSGAGYAKGFEIFYRDKALMDNFDGWVSYSYCISKRKTLFEGEHITPDYISEHSLTLVGKYWFSRPGILSSISCFYASSRRYPYYNEISERRTLSIPAQYGIDISISRPTVIFKLPSMIFLSWQNLTGYDKVLGYISIPTLKDPFGVYRTEKRTLFIGIFISMYND